MASAAAIRSRRVAVIGGGFAGLAAAYRLVRSGVAVELFERSGRLGGLAMSFPLRGAELEKYYHHWFTSDRDIVGLAAELGVPVRWSSPVMGMFCQGRVWRFTSPLDLLRFRPLGVRGKVRFALVTLFLQRYPKVEPFERVTAAEWLRRFAGREVYETVWGPLLRAKFGRHAERVSMAWIWSKMRLRGNSRTRGGSRESLGYPEGGFGRLVRELAAAIARLGGRIHTAERVVRIAPLAGEGGWEVVTPRRRERFDSVLSTVAPPLLARLAPELPPDYRRRCEGFEHMAILCTLLVLRRSLSPIYWLNVSDPQIPFGGLIEHTNFVAPSAYGGARLAYVSHYVEPDDPVYRLEVEALYRRYRPGLVRIQPEFDDGWVEEIRTFRDRWAQPIVTVDTPQRLLPLEAPLPGLFLATLSQVYPEDRGTNYAVRLGMRAAERVLRAIGAERDPAPRLASAAGS